MKLAVLWWQKQQICGMMLPQYQVSYIKEVGFCVKRQIRHMDKNGQGYCLYISWSVIHSSNVCGRAMIRVYMTEVNSGFSRGTWISENLTSNIRSYLVYTCRCTGFSLACGVSLQTLQTQKLESR